MAAEAGVGALSPEPPVTAPSQVTPSGRLPSRTTKKLKEKEPLQVIQSANASVS